jgi:hypothetical protein
MRRRLLLFPPHTALRLGDGGGFFYDCAIGPGAKDR